jgi:hypothetical protein
MKFILSFKLFEKTSLLEIGVPYSVMKSIQKNYAISDDAQWKNLTYKKDAVSALRRVKNTLIISIHQDKLFILFSYDRKYYVETYLLTEKDDFGNEQWKRVERIQSTFTEITKKIERGYKNYQLISGNWLHEFSGTRKLKKEEEIFEDITNTFKKEFAENFTRIVKKMYGRKSNIITNIIVNHLKNVKRGLTDQQISDILYLNVDRAKDIDKLKKKQKETDPYKLYSDIVKADSLTIFNEYLIKFEDEYSNKYKEYLNIPIMIEKWSREKIMTAFMYYLWSSNLMSL